MASTSVHAAAVLADRNYTAPTAPAMAELTEPGNMISILNAVFVSLLILLIAFANVLMGCELDLGTVYAAVKKPIPPAIGFFTQFFIMPVLAYTIAYCVLVDAGQYTFALGLFVTGCSPGGGASNFWTLLLGGNTHLSITMTFISTLASLVMMPLWMNLLGYRFLRKGFNQGAGEAVRLRVPYGKICISLLVLVVPLLLGVVIARKRPALAQKARSLLRPFVIFVLVFVIVFGTLSNWTIFGRMTWSALLAGLLLPWCGFMFGCFTSILLRLKPEDVTAIAIETGVQNTGIAIMLLKFSFPADLADESSLLPIVVACFTPAPLLLGYAIHSTVKRLKEGRLGYNTSSAREPDKKASMAADPNSSRAKMIGDATTLILPTMEVGKKIGNDLSVTPIQTPLNV